jgi:hypothetical protein
VGRHPPGLAVFPYHPVAQRETLFELLRYVYLWHFDDSFSINNSQSDTIEMWVRAVYFELDEGDKSQFAEVWFPQIKMLIHLKKANYSIPELGVNVRNDSFKIQNVNHRNAADAPRADYHVVSFSHKEVADHLFSTRNLKRFPDEVLRRNLRTAMIDREFHELNEITGDQVVYVSPISPVSNDIWVYHENFKRLIRFSADMDLSNPSYWSDTPIHVEVYDLDTAVVVSPDEIPGSDAYLTKDFTGRALFNCMILGMRIEVSEADAKKALREVQAAENSE